MGIFGMKFGGKNEAELEEYRAVLDEEDRKLKLFQVDLQTQERVVQQAQAQLQNERGAFEREKADFNQTSANTLGVIASERAELEKQRQVLIRMEEEQKHDFANAQIATFDEVIQKRLQDMKAREAQLQTLFLEAEARMKAAHEKEGEVAQRELVVTDREQKANAGFADTRRTLAEETQRQHEANLAEAKKLQALREELADTRKQLKTSEESLRKREDDVRCAEQNRDSGYSQERAAMDQEMLKLRQKNENENAEARNNALIALEAELTEIRTQRMEALALQENKEKTRIHDALEIEQKKFHERIETEQEEIQQQRIALEKLRGTLAVLESELVGRKQHLEQEEKRLEVLEDRNQARFDNRNAKLDEEVELRIAEIRRNLEASLNNCKAQNEKLLESIRVQTELLEGFKLLKKQLGNKDPNEIILEINSQCDELKRLREELASRPTEEMRTRYAELDQKVKNLEQRNEQLQKQLWQNEEAVAEVNELRRNCDMLAADNRILDQKAGRFEGEANEANAELNRLRAAYERPQEQEKRYVEIEMPHFLREEVGNPPQNLKENVSELDWLENIRTQCDQYGLHFNPRILKAFHTALKTAEWSPLTILAGVSGTGKSELPRLYSHFGGLFFEPLSVQPNWDSQESMLGFFNSIDNRFDAQPVLRFLAQSQKEWTSDYPGLKNAVCMILLDEMNLAHPELYFAEFLSKLELRRGKGRDNLPCLPIKIGSGMKPYPLSLGRNVLWTGTMNQDETTKSLSDKVLDRSIVIHFPRPTELKRRIQLKPLNSRNRGQLLHMDTWIQWLLPKSNFTDSEILPFKKYVERINDALGVVGRAIGHRVWQSVEYYMANYPDVIAAKNSANDLALRKAMHVAFEDQIVQKIMPKLRGIDTRGASKSQCLDVIRGQLLSGINDESFNLAEDFDLACELGYGQFIWQSANYLEEADSSK